AAMIAVATVIMAALLAVLLVVLCAWVGSVLGCGLALRARGHDGARRTALTFGALLPATFLTLAFVVSRFGRITGATAEVFYSIAVGLAAYLARRLTLWRPDSRGHDPDGTRKPEVSGPPRETRRAG
ncbi:MAG TPA: hypothetical protein VFX70_20955, partial [Mycobacteriales bacterium]|nr:hypothetical protein [Mycobacteriales bacterium]